MKVLSQKAFSLIELLLVIIVIGTSVFLLANLPNALNLISKSNHMSLAREIAVKQIDDKRSISYINLVNDTSSIIDSRLSLLPSANGTVVVADCEVTICTNSENIKKITVTVNWKDSNKNQTVSIDTFIGEGGINQ